MSRRRLLLSMALLSFTLLVTGLAAVAEEAKPVQIPAAVDRVVDFEKDVFPILQKNCTKCHGAEKQQAGLRLDRKTDAFTGGDSGKVIEPGKGADSPLVQLTAGVDPDRIMPPRGDRLTAAEIGILRGWIDQGAKWPDNLNTVGKELDHWSFRKLVRPAVPAVKESRWVRTPIDAFILARLEAAGIAPSPEADRPTLIRRLSLDLLGLPPSVEDVEAFVKDESPLAYEALVDRLLSSPRFGERWGRHWLDMARYADSDGYEKDNVRPFAYRYRDWVIDAINRDLPYDQFTLEQIAGDLLPNATLEQKLATGFHRNTLTNTEGGADKEEFRVAATVDRVNTTGAIWLGLTVGCAQCHTHKYDPITQREYYQLFAFYNSMDEVNVPAPRADEAQVYEAAKKRFDAQHAPFVAAYEEFLKNVLPARQAAWESTFNPAPVEWIPLEFTSLTSTAGADLKLREDRSVFVSGTNPDSDTYVLEATLPEGDVTGLRIETLTDDQLGGKGPGRTPHGNYVLSEVTLKVVSVTEPSQSKDIGFSQATADWEQSNNGKPFFTAARAIDGKKDTGWAVGEQVGRPHVLVLETRENAGYAGGTKLTLTLDQQHGTQHTLGRFRVSVTTSPRPVKLDKVPDTVIAALKIPLTERDDAQKKAVTDYFLSIDPVASEAKKKVDAHAAKAPKAPATMAQTVVERTEPRATHVHIRGDFLRQGDPVSMGTLSVLHPSQLPEKASRVDLAKWLMSNENPLTPRVTANQWWQWLMGRGLVNTPDDFGVKGELPSHPELLDWLAAELLEPTWTGAGGTVGEPWSRKRMIRLMVTSAVYRQSSKHREDLVDRDPKNVLLARQNRFRMEAEIIRDLNLAVSGLLDSRVGGPSVRPPLPAGVAELGYQGSVKWQESTGPDKYRRGMYVFFQRAVPYPMLIAFDSPDSNNTCIRRERSNTPLQALTLLNDPVFYECARAFGKTIVNESPGTGADRLARAFQACVARSPTPLELSRLHALYDQLLALAASNREQAAKAADLKDPADPRVPDLAAATGLARVLLNLDEFLTRE